MNKLSKILIIPLLIVMVFAFGMSASAELHTKWVAGDHIYFDSANIWAFRDDTDGVKLYDDLDLTFGTGNDATIEWDNDGTSKLILTCSAGFTFTGALGITGNILMATTSQIQFHDTAINIYAASDNNMVINADGTLIVTSPTSSIVATTSMTVTSPSFYHKKDASNYVLQTVGASGAVKVAVTGNTGGTYEIETDDGAITLDANTTITLDAGTGDIDCLDPIVVAPTTYGTHLDFELETQWVSGTLIRADVAAGAVTFNADVLGMGLDFNANVTAATDCDVRGYQIKLPSLSSAATLTSFTGFDLPTAGAATSTAGTFTWLGVNIQLPAITQTGGTLTATGVLVTGATITTGGTLTGISLVGNLSTAVAISGTVVTGISIAACTTANVAISGANVTGISMTGTYSAHGIAVGISGAALDLVAYDDRLVSIWGSSDATGGNVMPLYVSMTTDGACKARAAEFVLTPTAQLGQWPNAVKTYLNLTGASGGSGTVSSLCVELLLPDEQMTGNIAPLEIELVAPASGFVALEGVETGAAYFILAVGSGTKITEIDDHGYFLSLQGLTGASGDLVSENEQTLKCNIGTTVKYMMFSTTEGGYTVIPASAVTVIDFDLTAVWTSGTLFNVDFSASTTLLGAVVGFNLDLGANVVATAEENVKGIDINLPAMTMDGSTNTVKGVEITAAGAFTLATSGTAIWVGVDVTIPNTTEDAGTLTATGLKVTAGTITSGDQIGLQLAGTYTIALDIDDGTDASSLTAAAVVIDGGVAIVKQLYLGDDIDMGTSGSGVYEITLLNTNADALSITDGTGDFMVFKGTATRSVTITPALIVTGKINTDDTTDASNLTTAALVSDGGIACAAQLYIGDDLDMSVSGDGVYDITLKSSVNDALSITDGTDIIVFDTNTPKVTITPVTTITGALTLSGGLVVIDDQTIAFGTGSDVTMDWDNTRKALITTPAGHWVAPEGISDRFRLTWVAGQRGLPEANADIQDAAEGTRMTVDPDFEVLGTGGGAISTDYYAEGGIQLVTDGTEGHGLVMLPHLDTDQTAWNYVTWGTDMETRWECSIKTGSAITDCIIWAGLKLTNTPTTATDDDQAFFAFDEDVNGGEWEAISSIGDSDVETDTNLAVAQNTVYHLVIEILSDRTAKYYINGTLYYTSLALTDVKDLIPYIGIEEDGGGGAARTLYIRGQAISRKFE